MYKEIDFNVLLGEVLVSVAVLKAYKSEFDRIIFKCRSGKIFVMEHYQNCCEEVRIHEISGDVEGIIGKPVLQADVEESFGGEDDEYWKLWTFYRIATIDGFVTISWYGESNGYYSVDVGFYEVDSLDI